MNYQEMSDFEINKAVAIAIGYSPEMCEQGWEGSSKVGVEWENESGYPSRWFDYCNSWADAGPIIQKNIIPLNPFRDGWVAGERRNVRDKNPLRTAMIVFLMMKGGE